MKIHYRGCFIFFLAMVFLSTSVSWANTETPFISEVYPAPNSNESEWVEITNPTNQIATISGWLLYDQLSSPSLMYTIISAEIPPWEAISFDLATAKLNNSGDGVVLYNESGVEIDRLTYTSSTQGKSWHKLTQLSDPYVDIPSKNLAIVSPSMTPTSNQISVTPAQMTIVLPSPCPTIDFYTKDDIPSISITEIMACPPSGQQEWVELYNDSQISQAIDGWYITDSQDIKIYLSGSIPSNSYRVINWDRSLLNNQGDSVSLFTSSSTHIESVNLPQCIGGESYSLFDDVFTYTKSLTPGTNNQIQSIITATPSIFPTSIPISSLKNTPTKTVTNINNSTISAIIFTPALPSIKIEKIHSLLKPTSPPLQIIQTPKPQMVPWCGVIISSVSLVVAYYYLHAIS